MRAGCARRARLLVGAAACVQTLGLKRQTSLEFDVRPESGLRLGVEGSRIQISGFRVQGSGFRVWGPDRGLGLGGEGARYAP